LRPIAVNTISGTSGSGPPARNSAYRSVSKFIDSWTPVRPLLQFEVVHTDQAGPGQEHHGRAAR